MNYQTLFLVGVFSFCSCTPHLKLLQSLTSARGQKDVQKRHSSIDAMNYENADVLTNVIKQSHRKPVYINTTPLHALFRSLGYSGPYASQFLRMVSKIEVTPLVERMRLGNVIDQYRGLKTNYPEEFDVGMCFAEHLFFRARNTPLIRAVLPSSRDGKQLNLMDSLSSVIHNGTTNNQVLDSIMNAGISSIVEKMTQQKLQNYNKVTENPTYFDVEKTDEPMNEWSDVGFAFARRYLRKYLSSLPGNPKGERSEIDMYEDEKLINMAENLGRSFVLSTLGVMPGTPASGTLPDVLQSRAILDPGPQFAMSRTGNPIFDMGNALITTFQSANDITNALFCAKKYLVNHAWVRFQKLTRSALGVELRSRDLLWETAETSPPNGISDLDETAIFRSIFTDHPSEEFREEKKTEAERVLRSSSVEDAVETVKGIYNSLFPVY